MTVLSSLSRRTDNSIKNHWYSTLQRKSEGIIAALPPAEQQALLAYADKQTPPPNAPAQPAAKVRHLSDADCCFALAYACFSALGPVLKANHMTCRSKR